MVGFEPERWNERPSTDLPKATAFMDWRARGGGWRWQGNVSGHTIRPTNSMPTHTFVGSSQRLTVGPLFLSHDLQMDLDPTDSQWHLSRLRVRASLDLGANVAVRAGVARRESYIMGRLNSPFAPRNDRLEGGLAVRAGSTFLSADGAISEDASGQRSWGVTGSFASGLLPVGVGVSGSVSRWTGPYGKTLSASPGLNLGGDAVRVRLGYRFNRSDYLDRAVESHGGDFSLDVPLSGGMRASLRGRLQWGDLLQSQGVDLSLYRIF